MQRLIQSGQPATLVFCHRAASGKILEWSMMCVPCCCSDLGALPALELPLYWWLVQFVPKCGDQDPQTPSTHFNCSALGLIYNESFANLPASFPLDFQTCCVSVATMEPFTADLLALALYFAHGQHNTALSISRSVMYTAGPRMQST